MPDERWQSTHDVIKELKWVTEVGTPVDSLPAVTGPAAWKRAIPWSIVAVLAVITAVMCWSDSHVRSPEPTTRRPTSQDGFTSLAEPDRSRADSFSRCAGSTATGSSSVITPSTFFAPAQGIHGAHLTAVGIEGDSVTFRIPLSIGEPTFRGKLAEDGKTISGDFIQSGQTMPFRLTRSETPLDLSCVVDLSFKHHDDCLVLIRKRLRCLIQGMNLRGDRAHDQMTVGPDCRLDVHFPLGHSGREPEELLFEVVALCVPIQHAEDHAEPLPEWGPFSASSV